MLRVLKKHIDILFAVHLFVSAAGSSACLFCLGRDCADASANVRTVALNCVCAIQVEVGDYRIRASTICRGALPLLSTPSADLMNLMFQ